MAMCMLQDYYVHMNVFCLDTWILDIWKFEPSIFFMWDIQKKRCRGCLLYTEDLLHAHDGVTKTGNISALLALCAGNSPVTGEFPAQRSVTWSFDVFFDLSLNKRLSKQSRRR